MEDIIKADIFFFISSVAIIVFTICAIIIMFYVLRILKDMKNISRNMSQESDKFMNDIDSLRETVKAEGVKVMTVADFFLNLFIRRQKRSKEKKTVKTSHREEIYKN